MTNVIKAASAADFLSLVPSLLGFHPAESLVVVPFKDRRSLGAMRFDLPSPEDNLHRFASTVVGMACKVPDVTAIAVIGYSTTLDADTLDPIIRRISPLADHAGITVNDMLYVASDGWGSLIAGGFPAPLSELAGFEHEGLTPPAPDQLAGTVLPTVTEAQREAVVSAMTTMTETVKLLTEGDASEEFTPDAAAMMEAAMLDDLAQLFDSQLSQDPAELTPYRAASLLWGISRPAIRDIALVTWSQGMAAGDEAVDAQLRWEQGEEYPAHLAMHMWGEGHRPNPERLTQALNLCRQLAALGYPSVQPGVFATCAWLSWALGRSTHAEHYAQQAIAIEPEHGLAEIVASFVTAGHLPGWAFDGV